MIKALENDMRRPFRRETMMVLILALETETRS